MFLQALVQIIFYAVFLGIMYLVASKEWGEDLSLYLILCMIGLMVTWNISRRCFIVHYKDWLYNIIIFGFFFGIFMGIYAIIYHDIQNNSYEKVKNFKIVATEGKKIQGEGGVENYGVIAVAFETNSGDYRVGCGCYSDRGTDDIFSGRP